MAGVVRAGRTHRSFNEIDGIGGPGILRLAGIGKIHYPSIAGKAGIFQQGAKPDSPMYLWLLLRAEMNAFSITSPLKIKNAVGRQAMFIIAHQIKGGTKRERA